MVVLAISTLSEISRLRGTQEVQEFKQGHKGTEVKEVFVKNCHCYFYSSDCYTGVQIQDTGI